MKPQYDVIRTDTGHLRVGNKWFAVQDVSAAAFEAVRAAGSTNPAFDMPPFCFTGCPYGEAILKLGVQEVAAPTHYQVQYVPHDGKKLWRAREPIWPRVFGLDPSLYEK